MSEAVTRNNMSPSPCNGDLNRRAHTSRNTSYLLFFLYTKSIGFSASMSAQSSSQLPMALALNYWSPVLVTPRFHDTPTSSSTPLSSTLISQHLLIASPSTSACQDGSEANLPRSRGSSWRNASIFLCNPTFNASSRARARALAASSSSKHATIYR